MMEFVVKSAKIYDTEALKKGLKCALVGIYFLPHLAPPKEPRPIEELDRLHREYPKTKHPPLFKKLVLSGQSWTCLADLNVQAQERLFLIVEKTKATEGVTEDLKTTDPMAWVGAMNGIRNHTEEIILHEMIYGESAVISSRPSMIHVPVRSIRNCRS